MSEAVTAVPSAGTIPASIPLLDRVRRAGYALIAVQLAALLTWSALLFHRSVLTWDFATYAQPWYLIAHGHLNPYSTIVHLPFWQNDAEFSIWLLAPLYWVTHTDLVLPWLQDLSIAAAEAVAFTWLCELARSRCGDRDGARLAGLGLVLLLCNPWTWWSVSFDVHEETLVTAFIVLLAWDLSRGRRRVWLWLPLVLACGAPSATYVAGIGIGAVLIGDRPRRLGAAMVAISISYSLLVIVVHGDAGVPLTTHYGYLAATDGRHLPPALTVGQLAKAVALHPLRAVAVLWDKRMDIIANAAPGGLLGIGVPMLAPLLTMLFAENTLMPGYLFAEPMFQSVVVYLLLPVGTVLILAWLLRRHRRVAWALAGLLAAQALGWAIVWGPRTGGQWLRVSAPAAATLTGLERSIPSSAAMIVSQGVIGGFSDRADLYSLMGTAPVPVAAGSDWVVVAPVVGVELQSTASSMALVGELAGPLHATLVSHDNGVWAFRWTPPAGMRRLIVPGDSAPVPAWAADGAAGYPVLDGPASGWHMAATGGRGYVADGMQWREPAGRYLADVQLSTSVPVNVEVWDDTNGTLLARQEVPPSDGAEHVVLPVAAPDAAVPGSYPGWGPFRADFEAPPPGQDLEVRVWSPGGGAVNVYNATLTGLSGSGSPVPLP
jgi:hypothetical protein